MKAYSLSNQNVFQTLNGLWTGKKGPLVEACVLRNTNFGADGTLDPSDVAKLQVEKRQLEKRQLKRGDIILERSGGGPKQPVGRVAYFDLASADPFSFSNFTSAIRVLDRSLFVPQFVHYFLLDFYFEGGTKPLQSNTTGLRNLNFDSYLQIDIPCPLLDEQRKIAAALGKVQSAAAVEGNLVRVARELKQVALRQFFTCGLRGETQKQTDLGPLPESWEVVKIGGICDFSSGGTPDRGNPAYWTGGTIPWVKTGEVNYRTISEVKECITELGLKNSAAKLLPAGTLVMAMYGQGITRGRVARLGIAATTNQACAAITPRAHARVSIDFLYHYFAFNYEYLRSLGHGANQKNLNLEIIRQVAIPRPSEAEQREIVSLLATLDAKIAHHEARQGLLRELFRTLLHDLLTARRRVTDLDLTVLSS
jgi:type I restriction enzyme S subunit